MNDRWDIDPAPVRKILSEAEATQQALQSLLRHVETRDTTGTTPGADTIAGFYAGRVEPLRWIGERVTTVVDGAGEAVNAYVDGDLAMAAEHQHHAATIGAPVPFRENAQGSLGPRRPL